MEENNLRWKCVISEDAQNFSVNASQSTIFIPSGLSIIGYRMEALFAHEVGVHVQRRHKGKKSKLQLLSVGLKGYEVFEEGLADCIEQIVSNKFRDFSGFDKYLALSLALGELDGCKRDFKDTYNFLQNHFFERYKTKQHINDPYFLSTKRAWNLAWRIFRGGNPNIAGCCFTKDKIYREGNVKVWEQILSNKINWNRVFTGKYDGFNKEQVLLVDEYIGT